MDWYHSLADNNNFFTSLGNIAVFVQALFFILSLYLIWRQVQEAKHQIQESVKLARAANTQKLVELTTPFNLLLIQDPNIIKLWYQDDSDYDKLDQIDKNRHYELLTWWLILHENIYQQWKKGYMDNDIFESWKRDLIYFLMTKDITRYKSTWDKIFVGTFVEYVNGLIADIEAQKNISTSAKSESAVTTTDGPPLSNIQKEQGIVTENENTTNEQQQGTPISSGSTATQMSASTSPQTPATSSVSESAPSLPVTPPKSLSENQAEVPSIQGQNLVSE